ncbi:MAG: LacI family transcriptional regulator [Candidatus Neomarinimicrobiota bacterium]|nr:MAG: LacI family transcriptional regulator [Candidatus Neomarinimicrobiota bacterium]
MATIVDVAKLAGVSTATVSRVINETGNVRTATKKKVLAAVKELNFSPNHSAQVLQTKQTKTIGMIFPDASSIYFYEIIRGIISHVNKHGFQIIIGSAHDEEEELKTAFRFLNGRSVDGLVVMAPSLTNGELFTLPINHNTPIVFISVPPIKAGTTSVVLDNFNSAYEMTEHLIRLGHKRIAFIHGSPNNYDSKRRYAGYLKSLKDNGISGSIEAEGNFTEDSGYKACQQLIKSKENPTAIFAANDAMAIGAIESAKDQKLKVPEDIAIVGFDDISTSQYITPALTTIRVPLYKMGQLVCKTLLHKIRSNPAEHLNAAERIVIPLDLVIRESCGAKIK